MDKKYDGNEKYFEIPENPNYKEGIKIDKRFRLHYTCIIDKVNSMSPSFVNRFDVIVLEEQLIGISDEDLKKLIIILFKNSTGKIVINNNSFEKNDEDYEKHFQCNKKENENGENNKFKNSINNKNENENSINNKSEDELGNPINNKIYVKKYRRNK